MSGTKIEDGFVSVLAPYKAYTPELAKAAIIRALASYSGAGELSIIGLADDEVVALKETIPNFDDANLPAENAPDYFQKLEEFNNKHKTVTAKIDELAENNVLQILKVLTEQRIPGVLYRNEGDKRFVQFPIPTLHNIVVNERNVKKLLEIYDAEMKLLKSLPEYTDEQLHDAIKTALMHDTGKDNLVIHVFNDEAKEVLKTTYISSSDAQTKLSDDEFAKIRLLQIDRVDAFYKQTASRIFTLVSEIAQSTVLYNHEADTAIFEPPYPQHCYITVDREDVDKLLTHYGIQKLEVKAREIVEQPESLEVDDSESYESILAKNRNEVTKGLINEISRFSASDKYSSIEKEPVYKALIALVQGLNQHPTKENAGICKAFADLTNAAAKEKLDEPTFKYHIAKIDEHVSKLKKPLSPRVFGLMMAVFSAIAACVVGATAGAAVGFVFGGIPGAAIGAAAAGGASAVVGAVIGYQGRLFKQKLAPQVVDNAAISGLAKKTKDTIASIVKSKP